jgi:hypothetical protein
LRRAAQGAARAPPGAEIFYRCNENAKYPFYGVFKLFMEMQGRAQASKEQKAAFMAAGVTMSRRRV